MRGAPDRGGARRGGSGTGREGRSVLPVRSEARGNVKGVVHDTSATGHTVYVEPLAVGELGNQWRELQVQERHEVERILREISDAVGQAADEGRGGEVGAGAGESDRYHLRRLCRGGGTPLELRRLVGLPRRLRILRDLKASKW